MSMLETLRAAAMILALGAGAACAGEGPGLGQPIAPADTAAWDISIGSDGVGLPPGSGTAAAGAAIYAEKCALCHGAKGEGGVANRLVGGQGTLAGPNDPVKTVGSYWPYATTVFDFIRRTMPWTQPKTLSNDEVYATTAFILEMNGIIGENDVIDAQTLPKVMMPNRNGFVSLYPAKK
jgi:S-disulfanyl-L-cysteine oxidoreductase SoxD